MAIKHHTIPPLGTVDAIDQPQWAEAHDIDSGGLTFSDSSVQTTAAAGGNPTAKVGLATVNGSAAAFMRSDGAPALDQSITPTWTGAHVFNSSILVGAATGGAQGAGTINATGLFVNGVAVATAVPAGANPTAHVGLAAVNGTATTFMRSDGAPALDQTITPTWSGAHAFSSSILCGSATGGAQGAGTINATGIFVNGVAVSTAVGANPTGSVGLSAVNGSAATFMRSDGAPALSQAIVPTWTGAHTFTPSSAVVAVTINAPANAQGLTVNGSSTAGQSFGVAIEGGTTSADWALFVENQAGTATFLKIFGDGHGTLGASATAGLQWTAAGNITVHPQIQLGTGATDKVAFYGVTPIVQRASTSVQRTTNVSTVTGTISVSTAAINSIANSLKEVMNTLAAYGLWSIS